MKKLLVTFAAVIALSVIGINFSTLQAWAPDAKKIACEKGCTKAFDKCVKDAEKADTPAKKQAGKVACEGAKTKCMKDCK